MSKKQLMHIKVLEGNALEKDGHLVALALCVGDPKPDAIEPMIDDHDFTGSDRDMVLVYTHGVMMAQRLLLAGMGQRANLDTEIIRQAGARIAQKAHSLKLPQFALRVPSSEKLSPSQVIQALVEGVQLSLYRYVDLKTNLKAEDMHRVEYLELIVERDAEKLQQQVDRAQVIARGVMLARDLVNGPPNLITPTRLGHVAQDIGISTGMRVKVMGRPELESEGFGGLLAVAQGSEQPPRFICMEHGKARDDVATICLVGKGITFDTGGISIKPAAGMDEMKSDMGGAAAVLGAMQVVGELNLPIHVIGLISAAENMPGANAYRPGDVLTTLSGKTVEVLNTDAEGRIVMADALTYAQQYRPHGIIDIATLTGAMVIALGSHATGMISNNPSLAERVRQAGETTGERVWQLPLWDAYRDMMKSDVADIKNVHGRDAGAIAAAAFLEHFVGEYAWVHLDIAGTAYQDTSTKASMPKGATGVGVRLLVQVLLDMINS